MDKYLCIGGSMDGKFVKINRDGPPPYTIIVADPAPWNTVTETERVELMSEPIPLLRYDLIQMSWPKRLDTDIRWVYIYHGVH